MSKTLKCVLGLMVIYVCIVIFDVFVRHQDTGTTMVNDAAFILGLYLSL